MKRDLIFEKEFLSQPMKWPMDTWGRRRLRLKTWNSTPQRFGCIYAEDICMSEIPIYVDMIVTIGVLQKSTKETFYSLDALLAVWMID